MRIGADPELFAVDLEGKYKSLVGLIGGSKKEPRFIRHDGCAVQEDNVAAEFNIPPCESADQFVEAINFNLSFLERHVKEYGLQLKVSASAEFDAKELATSQAMEFGCEPDFNAWTEKINPRPHSRNKFLRSAGGHIHLETTLNPFHVARCFDVFVVIPSLSLDSDTQRRTLYGKSGSCRPKFYGVECRALSNFWLTSDELKHWVFGRSQDTLTFAEKQKKFSAQDARKIQTCINTSNLGLAREIIEEYNI